MKDKPNYYAILTANVRYDNDLPPNAKLLHAEINALCNMNGYCTAGTKYFANLYNVSKVSIQKWLKLLEDKNYIKRKVTYKTNSKEIDVRYITIINNSTQPNLTTPSKQKLIDNSNTKAYLFLTGAEFYDFYESKNWMIGKNKMKCWKSAIRTWESRDKNKGKLKKQINEYEKGLKMLSN